MEIKRISDHAVEKYCSYMWTLYEKEILGEEQAKEQILSLFAKTEPEKFTSGLVRRMIDNELQDEVYYRYHGWRFVVCKDTIVTIERNIFKKAKKLNFKVVNRNYRRNKRLKDINRRKRKG